MTSAGKKASDGVQIARDSKDYSHNLLPHSGKRLFSGVYAKPICGFRTTPSRPCHTQHEPYSESLRLEFLSKTEGLAKTALVSPPLELAPEVEPEFFLDWVTPTPTPTAMPMTRSKPSTPPPIYKIICVREMSLRGLHNAPSAIFCAHCEMVQPH